MSKSNLSSGKVVAIAMLATSLVSSNVMANVYKWRDASGRTQYSDTIPASSYSIVNRSELVNALQSKDVCTLPSTKPTAGDQSKLSQLSANFNFRVLGGNPAPILSSINGNNLTIGQRILPSSATKITRRLTPKVASPISKPITTSSTRPQTNAVSSANKIPATIASITKFVASHAMPAVVGLAAASPAVRPQPAPAANTPSIPVATNTTPIIVATNLPPNIVQAALMPAVDISKNVVPAVGFNTFRIEPTTEVAPNSGGEFRIGCAISHMSNDDPLVYPNQQGAAHHHTFFGNTSTNYKSNLATLSSTGNSTCFGGIMNRSAYWVPSMINTETNAPIAPNGNVLVYYKHGAIDGSLIQAPPKGLRMIAGNSKATTAAESVRAGFTCHPGPGSTRTQWPRTPNIRPSSECKAGDDLMFSISFPQCWDGKNLDSPNHKDHMAYPSEIDGLVQCPKTHPVAIPEIGINVHFVISSTDNIDKWRLASDNYSTSLPGGYSGHADWVNGWDEPSMAGIIKNCINGKKDAHAHLLCDGRKFY